MNERVMQLEVVAVLALVALGVVSADESLSVRSTGMEQVDLDNLVGQPVDIAPWAYAWRADRAVQATPEAYFIPRRLDRIDQVYRTGFHALPEQELKSIHYQMPDLLKPLLPPPKGRLLAGLLWIGRLADYHVVLDWPDGVQGIPSPEAVEVRVYPTSYGWFGGVVGKGVRHSQL